jgi:hypothetical protein
LFSLKTPATACLILFCLSGCQKVVDVQPVIVTEPTEVIVPSAEENDITQDAAAEIPGKGDLIPDGVLVNINEATGLAYLDTDGQLISEIETTGIGSTGPENVAIAGTVVPGDPLPPIIYHSWDPEQALKVNTNGKITTLRQINSFLAISSAPGQSAVSYSEVTINQDNFPHSYLYAGDAASLGSAESFYDLVDEPTYMALMPVGVKTADGAAQGVWYTKTGWGIGGADLIFPITSGLYFYELSSGNNLLYINPARSFQGISPDLTHAGAVDFDVAGNRAMTVIDLVNNKLVTFPLNPASDRGAGYSVFSPNNLFTAWLEASGSMISDPYDFHPRVRIGEIQSGDVVKELIDAEAIKGIDSERVTFLRPAGWLTNEALLIEIRGQDWGDVSLLRYDVFSGDVSVFSIGSFVGFGYQ